MEFKVPKFLERESNIAWGLSFKNLVVAVVLGFVLFGLFYVFQGFNLVWLWFIIVFLTAGVYVVFNFVKIEGQSAFEIFTNATSFVFSRRVYMWDRKISSSSPLTLAKRDTIKKKKETGLKIAPKSRLGILGSKIDISSIMDREEFYDDLGDNENIGDEIESDNKSAV